MNPSIFTRIWNDQVWSKVIAGLIVAGILGLLALITARLRVAYPVPVWALLSVATVLIFSAIWLYPRRPNPIVHVTNVVATPPDGSILGFPLKLYVTFRNDSKEMIDVRVFDYKPAFVQQKEFAEGVLTIELRQENWYPHDFGATRIAVLPGQKFKAWIGVDESKHEASGINSFPGVLGTLTLFINGQHKSFDLRRM